MNKETDWKIGTAILIGVPSFALLIDSYILFLLLRGWLKWSQMLFLVLVLVLLHWACWRIFSTLRAARKDSGR
jgi:hypothetical protein